MDIKPHDDIPCLAIYISKRFGFGITHYQFPNNKGLIYMKWIGLRIGFIHVGIWNHENS